MWQPCELLYTCYLLTYLICADSMGQSVVFTSDDCWRWTCQCVCACVRVCAFFGQLASGCRLQGGAVRGYKGSLKINLRACDLAPSVLRTAPLDRSVWRQCCSNAIWAFEKRRTAALVAKRKARKDPVAARGTICLLYTSPSPRD